MTLSKFLKYKHWFRGNINNDYYDIFIFSEYGKIYTEKRVLEKLL